VVVVNGLYPPLDDDTPGRRREEDPALRLWRRRRRVNDRELRRLTRTWKGPHIELPLLPFQRGPKLVSALVEPFERGLRGRGNGR
jgi:hypothetical protein